MNTASSTRKSVYNILLRMNKGAYSPIVLDGELKSLNCDSRDKAFITALFYGVIERQLTLDYIIDKFTRDKPPEQEARVLLRMALYQIMFMDSVPDSAAVNESVELSPKRAKGYVNAVLRNFLRYGKDLINVELQENLSLKYSCPEWLIEKWQREYGDEDALKILQTSLLKPPTFFRDCANENAPDRQPPTFFRDCANENDRQSQFLRQDLSSQLACEVLAPQPGETILDLCAAPGGKSFTIAQLMKNTGRIISCDINRKKLKLVETGAKKLGLSIIETRVNDAKTFDPDLLSPSNSKKADRVLCDVPCSGLGVIRRKPEIKYKPASDFDGLPAIQLQILQNGANYVRESGILFYSTCTLSRAENDEVVDKFVAENNNFELVNKKTIIPSEDGGDGFFMAMMKHKKHNGGAAND